MWAQNQKNVRLITALTFATLSVALSSIHCGGAGSRGLTFASPEEAAADLVTAVKKDDVEGLVRILGPSARELVITSDPVADRNERRKFAERADEKTQIVPDPRQPDGKLIEVGSDDWPFPIPLVQSNAKWHFDANEGHDEVLLRRIGGNEIVIIDVCRGYVEAQYAYAEMSRSSSGVAQYAQKFISTPGKRDGLYWKSDDPNDQSPAAEIIAQAAAQGYTDKSEPYHGYHFKVLTGQGPKAAGGAMNYMDKGVLTRGFALIAWPSDYGSTGLMTFLVNQTGIVYQKDLGEKTATIAAATTVYDPDRTWTPVPGSDIP